MLIEIGRAVIVKSGRDKGRCMVVVGEDNGFVLIADGDKRKLSGPKRKNEKHLALTGTVFDGTAVASDRNLRNAIAEFRGQG